MKNKWLVFSIIAVVLIVAVGFSAYNQIWSSSKILRGNVLSWEGDLIQVPGWKEMHETVASIPKEKEGGVDGGVPTKPLAGPELIGKNQEPQSYKTVTLDIPYDNNHSVSVTFKYFESNGRKVLVPNPGERYSYFVRLSDHSYLFEHGVTYFRLDLNDKAVHPFFKDEVLGYNRLEMKSPNGTPLYWVSNVSVTPSKDKAIFTTNRKGFNEGNSITETWIKDLQTGEEQSLLKGGQNVQGWDPDERAYMYAGDEFIRLDLDTREKTFYFTGFRGQVAISYPYLVLHEEGPSLKIIHADTMEETLVYPEDAQSLGSMDAHPEKPLIVTRSIPNEIPNGTAQLLILNAKSKELKAFDVPEGYYINFSQWHNTNELLVRFREWGTVNEFTHLIDVNRIQSLAELLNGEVGE